MRLKIIEIKGDGNCLFRAIADQLYGTEQQHVELRAKAIQGLEANKEIYRFYIENDVTIEDYIDDMRKDGVWGGQLEMTVLSEILRFNVIVHQVEAPIMVQSFHPPMGSCPTLHISYHLGQHYNSVRAVLDPCNGPAIDFPIGHTLQIDDLQPKVVEPQDSISIALKLCDKTSKELMKEALEATFGTLNVDPEHLSQLAHLVCEKYEDLSLAKGLLEMDIESGRVIVSDAAAEETKEVTPEQMIKTLNKDKNLIVNSAMRVV